MATPSNYEGRNVRLLTTLGWIGLHILADKEYLLMSIGMQAYQWMAVGSRVRSLIHNILGYCVELIDSN